MEQEAGERSKFLLLALSLITTIATFFPYVSIYSLGTDIQPISIVFVFVYILIIFCYGIPFQSIFVFLMLPFFLSIMLVFLDDDIFSSIRSILGYATICLVPIVFVYILNKHNRLFVLTLKCATIIYLIVGLIQLLVDRSFLSFLLNRASTSGNRGVTSLAPEPTFYGLICLFFILFFISLNIENKRRYILILLFQIVILAQSSMVILFILIFFFYQKLCNLKFKTFAFSFLSVLTALILLKNIDLVGGNYRILSIIKILTENPLGVLALDDSINDRASAIYFSFKGFLDNYFLPNGFSSYGAYMSTELPKQDVFLQSSSNSRIMSYYGGIMYELGIIGLLIPVTFTIIIIKSYVGKVRSMFLYVLFINTILFSAIPMSFPFIGVYMACLIYRKTIQATTLVVGDNAIKPEPFNPNYALSNLEVLSNRDV
jgi:hypothetical protein